MIRITIETLPYGDEDQPKVLGWLDIMNDATGTPESSNYIYNFVSPNGKVNKGGRVAGHLRHIEGPWELLQKVLNNTYQD